MITAEYLPSSLNVKTDIKSRKVETKSEWKLLPEMFQKITQILGQPKVDFLASRLSHQLSRYIARKADPNSTATNAMHQNWNKGFSYAFPQFCLLYQILRKVLKERTSQPSHNCNTSLLNTAMVPSITRHVNCPPNLPIFLPQKKQSLFESTEEETFINCGKVFKAGDIESVRQKFHVRGISNNLMFYSRKARRNSN